MIAVAGFAFLLLAMACAYASGAVSVAIAVKPQMRHMPGVMAAATAMFLGLGAGLLWLGASQ